MNVSVNIYIQAFVAEYLSGRNASQNRIGRLMLREDGTGAIEYFYGKIGEVTNVRCQTKMHNCKYSYFI
ncbi:hypothetical protein [Prevotella aurantiaca]|uniref:hypothetical protein n=1 Tax=Prevotella aurantiaca TaxID=596085 RepID=UPI0028ED867F|nr:hypothetical protein [Prevotella aurantiaca]